MMMRREEYRAVLRTDLMTFIERSFRELEPHTEFVSSPHLELLASKLNACREGKIRRLIVSFPPRSLKSLSVSVAFSAWLLGHQPDKKVLCASYGQDLSDKHARDTRKLMSSGFYKQVFTTRLSAERMAVADFDTVSGGGRLSVSVGGPSTGRGAEFIIIDDPLKPEEALSDTYRGNCNAWFKGSLFSRLNDKERGCIIIVMQRLHLDDLVGHVTEHDDSWEILDFPAIAEADECVPFETPFGSRVFRRKAGEALDPKRESLETLRRIRQSIGEYNFQSQYQQRPTPPGGNIVKRKWLRLIKSGEEPARFDIKLQSWDTANKSGELNNFSVCTTWGVIDGRFYLLDVYRARLNYPDLKRAVGMCRAKHAPDTILIEDKASGTALIQDLQREGNSAVRSYVPPPGNDKAMRLHALTALFENGYVFLLQDARWFEDYVAELTGFPGSKYSDQVDSTTQALAYLRVPSSRDTWRKLARHPERMAEFGRQLGIS